MFFFKKFNIFNILLYLGDIVPSEKVYTFFTIIYIIFGLSLATMCIDLAGTEYLKKIYYLGQKMDDAKGAALSSLEVAEHLLTHRGVGLIKTAGGKLLPIKLSNRQIEELFLSGGKPGNILREPLTKAVQKLADEHNIKVSGKLSEGASEEGFDTAT